jgi:ribosome maturation factor RimP
VAEASRACSSALDAAELAEATPDAYVLEVTSPGTDRPLTEPRHWRRNTGRLVEVRRRGAGALTGRLLAVDDDGVTVETKGAAQSVPFADITKGVVQLEFSRAEQEARA